MVKAFVLLFCTLFVAAGSRAQRSPASTADLARQIQQHYNRPADRIRIAYTWVANNIRYDTKGVLAMNHGLDPRGVVDAAFSRRSGVCENFAAIFADVCQKMGFRSVVIEGYTAIHPDQDKNGHSWSAVYIGDDWYLFDPTWDMGRTSGFNYFMKTGEAFISTHVPFDPMWQMLEHPVSENGRSQSITFNYKDSIDRYLSSDSLHRYESAVARIREKNTKNQLSNTHLKILQNDLEIKRQEEQMNWYDQAVAFMNRVTDKLNAFIDLRNSQAISARSDESLRQMLSGITTLLDSASYCLKQVDDSRATLVYGTDAAKEQLKKLSAKYANQQLFLDEFLKNKTAVN